MTRMIDFYNRETDRLSAQYPELDKKQRDAIIDDFIDVDAASISWSRALKQDVSKGRKHSFAKDGMRVSLYRPFVKQWLYFDRRLNEMVYQMPRVFPDAESENLVIMVKARWRFGQVAFITNQPPAFSPDGGEQCFPLYRWLSS